MTQRHESPPNPVGPRSSRRCHCSALREAARYVTLLYDRHLAAAGLRSTQFSILARLKQLGPTTINALAQDLVMDRTTVGRNILPLQRRRLIVVKRGESDARRKELHLTAAGLARLEAGSDGWATAQAQFEGTLGEERASQLRDLLRVVVGTDFRAQPEARARRTTTTD
jgi:DNA-binding MarR family transcriptional regulator